MKKNYKLIHVYAYKNVQLFLNYDLETLQHGNIAHST